LAAENCLKAIDGLDGPVRDVLERLRQEIDALLERRPDDAPAPNAPPPVERATTMRGSPAR
jgi:hypothetical protein